MSRIYLVEDDSFFRELMRMDLAEAGHDVKEYCNGNDVLSELALQAPDILITDIVMPDGEGMGTIRFARKLYPELRIIAISAHADYLEFASMLGASETVKKPFRTKAFAEAV
jgi:two-component system nitrogen regulation response regulator GlnG